MPVTREQNRVGRAERGRVHVAAGPTPATPVPVPPRCFVFIGQYLDDRKVAV